MHLLGFQCIANPMTSSRPIEWDRKKYGISKRDLKDEVQWYRYKWSKSDKKYKLKRRWSLEEINYPKDFMVERVDGRLQWYEFQVHEDTKSLTRTSRYVVLLPFCIFCSSQM